jgi:hypothetical protein
MVDHWLVRTKDNVIAGPYTSDQVRKLVLDGQLGYQDEICQANHYWIFVHERHEVKKQLGIDVPKPAKKPGEEVTETETQTETDAVLELEQASMDQMDSDESDGLTRVGTRVAHKVPGHAATLGASPAAERRVSEGRPAQDRRAAPAPSNGSFTVHSVTVAETGPKKWVLAIAVLVAAAILYRVFWSS